MRKLLIGTIIPAIALGLFLGLRKRDEAQKPEKPPQAVVAPAAPSVEKPAPIAKPLVLPVMTVDATKIIWHSQSEVGDELGAGKQRPDKRWRYDLGDRDFAVVTFEKDRAVGIEVHLTRPGPYTEEESTRIRVYFGLGEKGPVKIRGRQVLFGESFLNCWRSRETAEFWTGRINSTTSRGLMPSAC